MFIPDPTFFHPGSKLSPSQIRIKEFNYFCPAREIRRPKRARIALQRFLDLLRCIRPIAAMRPATLDDSTPQRRISELRVWSYEPFFCVRVIIVRLN
jgi:hypothetical protein